MSNNYIQTIESGRAATAWDFVNMSSGKGISCKLNAFNVTFKHYGEKKFKNREGKAIKKQWVNFCKKEDLASIINDLSAKKELTEFEQILKKTANLFFQDGTGESYMKEYRSHVKNVPTLILNNGLGPTVAFIYEKAENGNHWELIYKQIQAWIASRDMLGKYTYDNDTILELGGNVELARFIILINSNHYRAVSSEVLALFEWMRRFAKSDSDED